MKVVPASTTSFEELTPTLLREFVGGGRKNFGKKIPKPEKNFSPEKEKRAPPPAPEALDGKRRGKLRRQEIEIYYSFVGKVELPD